MAIHSSILAWKIPWAAEPGRLQFMGSQNRTQLSDSHTHTHIFKMRLVLIALIAMEDKSILS